MAAGWRGLALPLNFAVMTSALELFNLSDFVLFETVTLVSAAIASVYSKTKGPFVLASWKFRYQHEVLMCGVVFLVFAAATAFLYFFRSDSFSLICLLYFLTTTFVHVNLSILSYKDRLHHRLVAAAFFGFAAKPLFTFLTLGILLFLSEKGANAAFLLLTLTNVFLIFIGACRSLFTKSERAFFENQNSPNFGSLARSALIATGAKNLDIFVLQAMGAQSTIAAGFLIVRRSVGIVDAALDFVRFTHEAEIAKTGRVASTVNFQVMMFAGGAGVAATLFCFWCLKTYTVLTTSYILVLTSAVVLAAVSCGYSGLAMSQLTYTGNQLVRERALILGMLLALLAVPLAFFSQILALLTLIISRFFPRILARTYIDKMERFKNHRRREGQ